MKNLKYIGLLLGFVILVISNTKAQYYYTSYGFGHEWYLPKYVHQTIYDSYYGFEIAHVNWYKDHRHRHFNVLLHRNGIFVELNIDNHGRIYKKIRHRYYNPLLTHHCTDHCGYHKIYYQTYYPSYYKVHHGYKTTVYVNSTSAYHHKYNQYYTNIHVDPKTNAQKHYHKKDIQRTKEEKHPRVVRKQDRNNEARIKRTNPGSSKIQQVNNRIGQNTSRGRTRITMAQLNGHSPRNR